MLPMIQAISEIDPGQAIPVISYIRQRPSALREDTAQYNRYVLDPAGILQMRKHRNCIQIQQTTWTQESLERRSRWLRSKTHTGPVRENTP